MNQEHLEILKTSVEKWNNWREEQWDTKPDLTGADLRNMNLFKIKLDDADLTGADLRGSILVNSTAKHAICERAKFDGAKMQGANLSGANLTYTDIKNANLMGTIFRGAYMVDADLRGSDCTGAKFEGANLERTLFYNAKVVKANFDDTNVNESKFHAEHFADANIPLTLLKEVEKKKTNMYRYVWSFIIFTFILLIGIGVYVLIFQSETPGASTTNIRAGIYKQIGGMYNSSGKFEKALEFYYMSAKYNPKNSKVYYEMGSIYRRMAKNDLIGKKLESEKKNLTLAIYYYTIFVQMEPDSPEIYGPNSYIQYNTRKVKNELEIMMIQKDKFKAKGKMYLP